MQINREGTFIGDWFTLFFWIGCSFHFVYKEKQLYIHCSRQVEGRDIWKAGNFQVIESKLLNKCILFYASQNLAEQEEIQVFSMHVAITKKG